MDNEKPSFFGKIRSFIGVMVFRLYLRIEGYTEQEFFEMIQVPFFTHGGYNWVCSQCGASSDYFIVGNVDPGDLFADCSGSNTSGKHE